MTETTGATCVTFPDDLSLGHVGGPFPCCEVRSVSYVFGFFEFLMSEFILFLRLNW